MKGVISKEKLDRFLSATPEQQAIIEHILEGKVEEKTTPPPAAVPLAPVGPPVEGFIGKPELARRLGKSVRTVDTWMELGILPYYKIGRSVEFKWSEVERHLTATCRMNHEE